MFKNLKIGRNKDKTKKRAAERKNSSKLDWHKFQPVVNDEIPEGSWHVGFLEDHYVAVLRHGDRIIEVMDYRTQIWKNAYADIDKQERPFPEEKIWEYIYQKVREFTSDVIYIRLEDLFKEVGELSQKDATNLMYLAHGRKS